MPKKVAIYARVSTDSQTTENQLLELGAVAKRMGWHVTGEQVDQAISGSKGRNQRPEFDRLLKDVTRKEFNIVAAWSVDRLGRSLQHLVEFINEIHASGVDLYLHQQGINTATPPGKALFKMCGVFAEFERLMIRERVISGIARTKVCGTKSGKPHGRPANLVNPGSSILKALSEGKGILKTAKELGIGVSTVQRIIKESQQAIVAGSSN